MKTMEKSVIENCLNEMSLVLQLGFKKLYPNINFRLHFNPR